MNYTGERVVPTAVEAKENLQLHMELHGLVYDSIKDKTVLDLGCGCGYGTFEYAKRAKLVVGIDICLEAVQFSRVHYSTDNLMFIVSDSRRIPFLEKFDCVVSIEMFEYIENVEKMIIDAYRALKYKGMFLFSTPNGDKFVYNPQNISERQRYHVRHYTRSELEAMLCKYFHITIEEKILGNQYFCVCYKK